MRASITCTFTTTTHVKNRMIIIMIIIINITLHYGVFTSWYDLILCPPPALSLSAIQTCPRRYRLPNPFAGIIDISLAVVSEPLNFDFIISNLLLCLLMHVCMLFAFCDGRYLMHIIFNHNASRRMPGSL